MKAGAPGHPCFGLETLASWAGMPMPQGPGSWPFSSRRSLRAPAPCWCRKTESGWPCWSRSTEKGENPSPVMPSAKSRRLLTGPGSGLSGTACPRGIPCASSTGSCMDAFFKRPGPGTSAPSSAAGRSTPPTARAMWPSMGRSWRRGPPPTAGTRAASKSKSTPSGSTAAGVWPCAAPPP